MFLRTIFLTALSPSFLLPVICPWFPSPRGPCPLCLSRCVSPLFPSLPHPPSLLSLSLLSLSLSISIQDSKRFLQWQPWLWEPPLDWQAVPTPLCEFLCTCVTIAICAILSLLLVHTLALIITIKRTNMVVRLRPRRTLWAGLLLFLMQCCRTCKNMREFTNVHCYQLTCTILFVTNINLRALPVLLSLSDHFTLWAWKFTPGLGNSSLTKGVPLASFLSAAFNCISWSSSVDDHEVRYIWPHVIPWPNFPHDDIDNSMTNSIHEEDHKMRLKAL